MSEIKNFNINICVCCGKVIPEGIMVCLECENSIKPKENKKRNRKGLNQPNNGFLKELFYCVRKFIDEFFGLFPTKARIGN